MSNSILIIGMGFVGKALAASCFERGYEVCAVKKTLTSDDINLPIALDVLNVEQNELPTRWAGYQTWVCLLPPSACVDYVKTVQCLLRAATLWQIHHFVLVSSIGVYGALKGVCDEQTPVPEESYSELYFAEQLCLSSRLPHVDVARLGGLYAVERHPIYHLLSKTCLKNGDAPVNMVHREKAVEALCHLIATPNGHRVRNIVEAEHPSRREFYQCEANKLGVAAPEFLDGGEDGKIVVSLFDDGGVDKAA